METHLKHALRLIAPALGGLLAVPFLPTPACGQDMLVTGKMITEPPLGTQFNVGSFPANMLLSPDGQFAIVSDVGFQEELWSLRTSDGVAVSGGLDFNNSTPNPPTYGLYYGLAFAPDGTLYAAEGGNESIAVVNLAADGMPDCADPGLLNALIWKSVKGIHSRMPEPGNASLKLAGSEDERELGRTGHARRPVERSIPLQKDE